MLAAICDDVAAHHKRSHEIVIVTSGAIIRGMQKMGMSGRPSAIEDLQAASAVGQGALYQVYDELLRERGLTSAQILLTFHDMSARAQYLNARHTLRRLLDWHVVPVINENDTTATEEITFGDNDFLAAQVAILIGADQLVLLTSTDGVFTGDPAHDPDAPTDRRGHRLRGPRDPGHDIGPWLGRHALEGRRGRDGHRGRYPGDDLQRPARRGAGPVLAGEPEGTRFPARGRGYSSFKLWLKYAKPSHGTVVVDAGAARALRDGGTSLLPVGVVDVHGEFEAGDAVDVRDGADVIGKGISNYSAGELRSVKGLKSESVRAVLPRATDEAVHRDYFVLA